MLVLKSGNLLANIFSGEAHAAGAEDRAGKERVCQPVDDFASLVGRSEHDDFSGDEFRGFLGETADDDASHGVSDKVGRLF